MDKAAVAIVAVAAAVTVILRFAPFVIFKGENPVPQVITYLGKVLPYAIMGMLVIFCMKDISFLSADGFVPKLIAAAVVIGLYVWKRNTLASIIAGTVSYMLLVQLVF